MSGIEDVDRVGVTPPVSGGTARALLVSVGNGGAIPVVLTPFGETATLSNVAQNAASVTLQASNGARRGLTVFNDSVTDLYVKLAATAASLTSFSYKLTPGATLELPIGAGDGIYRGAVTGIWGAAGAGAARMTEFA